MSNLTEGRLAAELQIGVWPPPVTQTLLQKSDGQLALTVRGKPSGRLRVALERHGFAPIVVRTVHLRMRAPTMLKMQIAWQGNDAVVVAAGQTIGSTAEFDPVGVVSPADVEQSAPPLDHVDNARTRELRRKQAAALVSGSMSAGALAEQYLAELMPAVLVVEDLASLVRQGRYHHLAGLITAVRRLIQGDGQRPALLQFCAGLLDCPLILNVPINAQSGDDPAMLLTMAFAASPVRDAGHELAIDLDAWLRQEVPWLETTLPVGWLLHQVELAVVRGKRPGGSAVIGEEVVRSSSVSEALCRLAECVCILARQLVPAQARAEAPSRGQPA